ncbi:hypothetical protein L1987_79152 [Smallanthus sonchifolius]|uniref:Uncharacterized protein n=1 Tax=Smallanthus sonchifolius TaxID=185202 RepID=A0ACB8ZEY2_9ASTR|nr:hypothetical protein L1987_79152 [Smallanthus sonchifolius]
MADALSSRVKQLIKHCHSSDIEPEQNGIIAESFDGLLNRLIEMMVGYENEEVLALLKQMEDVVSRGWYGMVSSMLDLGKFLQEGRSISINLYTFLRILDVESILISLFPLDVVQICTKNHMEYGKSKATVYQIWGNLIEEPIFLQVTGKDGCQSPSALASSKQSPSPRSCHNIFSWTPNLRKLGFCGPLISSQGDQEFPNLGSLKHLQKLKLLNTFPYYEATRSCNPILFPKNLKKLTLSNTGMDWEEMWTLIWQMEDSEFLKLKVLKLHDVDIKQWVCSRNNFPRLQRLVVQHCLKLGCIPTALGKIFTLEVIEVNGCNLSTYTSAMEIQKEQESEGNNFLKVNAKQNF